WHFSLALMMLVHARYVMHVSNEVGPKTPSLSRRLRRGIAGQLCQAISVLRTGPESPPAHSKSEPGQTSQEKSSGRGPKPKGRKSLADELEPKDGAPDGSRGSWRKRFSKRVLGRKLRWDLPHA